MAMHSPPHPGRIVRQECIEPLGLSITAAASALGVTRQTVDRLVNERAGISPEMAIRLAKAFGGTPELWVDLQAAYDLAQVRRREAEIAAQVRRVERADA